MGLLGFGIAVPLLYYGVQVVAAPFYSGFSFLSTTASELGSDGSTRPSIFNAGAILVGISSFIAAVGFLRAPEARSESDPGVAHLHRCRRDRRIEPLGWDFPAP